MKSWFKSPGLRSALLLILSGVLAVPARAEIRPRTLILRSMFWGAAAGATAGIVSYPFAKSLSTVLIGAFTGFVLGTGAGLYYLHRRDGTEMNLERSTAYDDETADYIFRTRDPTASTYVKGHFPSESAPLIELNYPIYRF